MNYGVALTAHVGTVETKAPSLRGCALASHVPGRAWGFNSSLAHHMVAALASRKVGARVGTRAACTLCSGRGGCPTWLFRPRVSTTHSVPCRSP